jgi:uncharacterized protein YdhG (YjbR/CyaY superfamily)
MQIGAAGMKSTAVDVQGYIAEQPEQWRGALITLRAACRRQLRDYAEVMAYGMPAYVRDGQTEVSFAKQAHYLSLYIMRKPVLDAHRVRLSGHDVGKGCIRFRRPTDVDWEVVDDLLIATASSRGEVC